MESVDQSEPNNEKTNNMDNNREIGTNKHMNNKKRLWYIMSLLTIEPMMFFQGLAAGISQIATDQMVMYKICRGKKQNKEFLQKKFK